MVICTQDKRILRLEFDAPFTIEHDSAEATVVCFLRATDHGIDIFYSHHVFRRRQSANGPYQTETYQRVPMNDALRSWIDHCAMTEFWSATVRSIQTSPAAPDEYSNLIDYEGRRPSKTVPEMLREVEDFS